MARFTTAEMAMKLDGKKCRRTDWPPCKVIRTATDADRDNFMHMESIEGLILEDCEKACDCKVSVWVPEKGEKEAGDWEVVD